MMINISNQTSIPALGPSSSGIQSLSEIPAIGMGQNSFDTVLEKVQQYSQKQQEAKQEKQPEKESLDAKLSPKPSIAQEKELTRLREVSEDLEALFVNMMFKEMRKSLGKHKLVDGKMAEEIFQDMLYDEYAKVLAKNEKLGLAEMVYRQMSQSITGNAPSLSHQA